MWLRNIYVVGTFITLVGLFNIPGFIAWLLLIEFTLGFRR